MLVCRDVTERKLLEQTLEHMAMHDPLTDLPNRKLYDRELRRARARAEREGRSLALMLLDLDRFKQVNDTYGHQVGDQLLVEVARRLAGRVREGDLVARVGGDEFAVLAEGAPAPRASRSRPSASSAASASASGSSEHRASTPTPASASRSSPTTGRSSMPSSPTPTARSTPRRRRAAGPGGCSSPA